MPLKNTDQKWGVVSQLFHWGMFLILVGMYTVAYIMQDMAPGTDKGWLYGMHKQIGVTMLGLFALRLWWRQRNAVPLDPPTLPSWQAKAARANIHILYLLLCLFPLSGVLMTLLGGRAINYFGLFKIPALIQGKTAIGSLMYEGHVICSYLLIGFGGLHILAGLYHHFRLKDDVLKRMLPGT